MPQQNEMQAINQALNRIEKLQALIAFLEKSRDAENESDVADDLRRREYLHF